ncbi:MAG: hypothetical protein JSV80_04230 [Acidobacteriota bacterium]|nr:MAG: hypothetical protein JSV80_04230 [Acidobacteriota bacterium]
MKASSATPLTGAKTAPRASALVWLALFGIAFGWVEAMVVVYLRQLYYPDGFSFPLEMLPAREGLLEVAREAATLVMLLAVARLGARRGWGRFGLFAVAFGVWDLVYYAGLYVAIGWPASLCEWDVLFLIPGVWTGPVWSPCLIAVALIGAGSVLYWRGERSLISPVRWFHVVGATVSLALLLGAFLNNQRLVISGGVPTRFPLAPYAAGTLVGLWCVTDLLLRRRTC